MELKIGTVSLHYELSGEGADSLLFLHGWGGSCASFAPAVRDFASDKRIVNLDFPGFGQSSEPDVPWTVADYRDAVLTLLDTLKITKTDIVAHSFGGRVALMINAERPSLVRRQILTGCAGLTDPDAASKGGAAHALSRLYDNRLSRRLLGEKGVEKIQNVLRSHFGSEDYKNASPLMRETFKRVLAQDLRYCLPEISAPTLLVWGANDTATPLWIGREMEKSISDAALVVFENSGHFAYLEQYARFITIAKNFLNS
ncbi:MAG: alpha/beta hydrolase [Clostridia bacterium]|nr:alpha/beta hydrolase [Clostridia bacterium]